MIGVTVLKHIRMLPVLALLIATAGFEFSMPGDADAQEPKVFSVTVMNGAIDKKHETLKVEQGDTVLLRFVSDQAIDLHMHGYDLTARPGPGKPALLHFEAKLAGRFPIEIHGAKKSKSSGALNLSGGHHDALLYLEVAPN